MVLVVGLDSVNKGDVIDMPGDMGEPIRDVLSGLAVALKLEGAADRRMGKGQASLELTGDLGDPREWLAVELVEDRLVFEGVHLADSSPEKHEDTVLGLALDMRQPDLERVHTDIGPQIGGERPTKSQGAKSVERSRQKIPARKSSEAIRTDCVICHETLNRCK